MKKSSPSHVAQSSVNRQNIPDFSSSLQSCLALPYLPAASPHTSLPSLLPFQCPINAMVLCYVCVFPSPARPFSWVLWVTAPRFLRDRYNILRAPGPQPWKQTSKAPLLKLNAPRRLSTPNANFRKPQTASEMPQAGE